MFADHLLEIFDCLQRHVILFVAKVHERARVSAALGNHNLNRAIWIDLCNRDVFAASGQRQSQSD